MFRMEECAYKRGLTSSINGDDQVRRHGISAIQTEKFLDGQVRGPEVGAKQLQVWEQAA